MRMAQECVRRCSNIRRINNHNLYYAHSIWFLFNLQNRHIALIKTAKNRIKTLLRCVWFDIKCGMSHKRNTNIYKFMRKFMSGKCKFNSNKKNVQFTYDAISFCFAAGILSIFSATVSHLVVFLTLFCSTLAFRIKEIFIKQTKYSK